MPIFNFIFSTIYYFRLAFLSSVYCLERSRKPGAKFLVSYLGILILYLINDTLKDFLMEELLLGIILDGYCKYGEFKMTLVFVRCGVDMNDIEVFLWAKFLVTFYL